MNPNVTQKALDFMFQMITGKVPTNRFRSIVARMNALTSQEVTFLIDEAKAAKPISWDAFQKNKEILNDPSQAIPTEAMQEQQDKAYAKEVVRHQLRTSKNDSDKRLAEIIIKEQEAIFTGITKEVLSEPEFKSYTIIKNKTKKESRIIL